MKKNVELKSLTIKSFVTNLKEIKGGYDTESGCYYPTYDNVNCHDSCAEGCPCYTETCE
ncbi:hypothetical protein AB9P05_12860 [Roseivirga sp. BDSF3-8]|uniref:hypothetical protein n=1 Tax=Roseivirga sp. BDSF3-8 TaxID=3241598 RepID=UPI00353246FE